VIRSPQATSRVSLILADVDGSLPTEDKRLTPRGMAMLIEPLALRTPIAGFNGGAVVHPDMTVIHQHVLHHR